MSDETEAQATESENQKRDPRSARPRSEAEVSLIQDLIAKIDMTPQEISEALDGRVSSRTIYRWKQGESFPQQKSDIEALQELAGRKKV